jgi:hypothetical protein
MPASDESVLNYAPKAWEPLWRSYLPEEEIARARELHEAAGAPYEPPDEVWVNDEYQCFVKYLEPRGKGGTISLSIKRNDKRPAHDWRELQAIKNEVAGWEREAVEIYPAESRLVDEADQSWLWVMPAGERIAIGFGERVVDTPASAANRAKTGKGSQRDWRPGISTGPHYKPGG